MTSGRKHPDCPRGSDSLRQGIRGVGLGVQPLPLQVAQLDIIAVNEDKMADAAPRESASLKTAQGSATNYRGTRPQQAGLAFFTYGSEPDLP
jgi:hypothetical protein